LQWFHLIHLKGLSSQGIKYLNRLQRFKKIGQPLIIILDKLRIFSIIVPLLNFVLRKLKIKKQFQRNLNYRLIGKSFKDSKIPKNTSSEKVILFPFFSGGNNIFFFMNLVIGYRMAKKGYRCVYMVCDKAVPVCNSERAHKTRESDSYLCYNCSQPYKYLKRMTHAEILYISEYNHAEDSKIAMEETTGLNDLNSLLNYHFDSIPIGKLAEKSVMRYFFIGKLEDNEKTRLVYQKFIKSIITIHLSLKHLIQEQPEIKPESIMLYNGTLSLEGYYRLWAEQHSINYITQETYIGQDSWIYKKNDEVMKLRWDKEWDEFQKLPFMEEQENQAISYLNGLSKGKEMYDRLNMDIEIDYELRDKDYVVLFTNLNFDTAVLGRNPIFDSLKDWINKIIDFWINNKPKQLLVIRVHPAEAKLIKPTNDFIGIYLDEIQDKLKGQNIKVYGSKDEVSSYELIKYMKAGLVYSSTIGMEIAFNNKPCLIAGDAFYKNESFVMTPPTKANYFDKLKQIIGDEEFSFDVKQKDLLKFIHFIYFNRVKRLAGIKIDHKMQSNEFDFKSVEEFNEKNKVIFDEFEKEIF